MTKKEAGIPGDDTRAKIDTVGLQSHVEAIEKKSLFYSAKSFDKRADAIDFIECQVIAPIEELLPKMAQSDKLILLKNHAEKVKTELEEINIKLFRKLRTNIRMGKYTGKQFKDLVNEYFNFNSHYKEHPEEPYYDNLDIFINGLLFFEAMPEQTKDLEPEMVYYQKTPARIVFEIAERSHFTNEDIFVDLGAGLGQAAILIKLLAGITVKGVEVEPAFCGYATASAKELNLLNVAFINSDARQADYSDGTVFFMYTPFSGYMLQQVLENLKKESLQRKIKIITYGPCTAVVALESWLYSPAQVENNIYKPRFFSSV